MTVQTFKGPYDINDFQIKYLSPIILEYNQELAKIKELTKNVLAKVSGRRSNFYDLILIEEKRYESLEMCANFDKGNECKETICLILETNCLAFLRYTLWSESDKCYIFTEDNGDFMISLEPVGNMSELGTDPKNRLLELRNIHNNMTSFVENRYGI